MVLHIPKVKISLVAPNETFEYNKIDTWGKLKINELIIDGNLDKNTGNKRIHSINR